MWLVIFWVFMTQQEIVACADFHIDKNQKIAWCDTYYCHYEKYHILHGSHTPKEAVVWCETGLVNSEQD